MSRCRTAARVLAASLLMATAAAAAEAQKLGTGRLFFAGGTGSGWSAPSLGYYAVTGLSWKQPFERLGVRAYASYFENTASIGGPFFGCADDCRNWRRERTVSLESDIVIELARGRVRPYLVTGAFFQRSNVDLRRNFTCTTGPGDPNCVSTGTMAPYYSTTELGLGFQGGIGVGFSVRGRPIFIETRLRKTGDDYYVGDATNPIVIGIRF